MNKHTIYLFFCLAIVTQGCVFQSADTNFARDFFHATPPGEWEKRMELYSLEDQYKIYVYGMQVMHPPLLELSNPIAKQGQKAIPFLISKLTSTDNDIEVNDIVNIIQDMSRSKYYDAKQDFKLIEIINNRISKMENTFWKRMASDSLKQIQNAISNKKPRRF